ncbi:MAG: hypothetical protein ABI186_05840 [Candidatus Elarobacter sp.]
MRTFLSAARYAAVPLAFAAALMPAAVQAKTTPVFEGNVVHISTSNIKVKNPTQTLSFLLVPHFDQVFSGDGKTTYQMTKLHAGQLVKVYYDQKGLGIRHADRILVLNHAEMRVKQVKS